MAWTKIKKNSFSSDEPIITIFGSRFSYNSVFSKIAELERKHFVTYFIDEENRKIGFEFKDAEDQDNYKVIGTKQKGYNSQSTELFAMKWIQKISGIKGMNRFKPIREGNLFVITVMPVFENSIMREDYLKIPAAACGIYRYLDQGQVVYIGKGNIRNRYNDLPRKEWQFDKIEYSLIENIDLQFEWECFWIERYKATNDNRLPVYNLISGKAYQPQK